MKLLIDAHVFDGMYQGSRTYLKGLYRQMAALKPDWEFYFAAQDTDNLKQIFGESDNIFYVELKSRSKYKRLALELPSVIRRHRIDYAHFQYITPLLHSCRYIVTIHDILFEEPRFKSYFPMGYRLKNGFLFRRSAKKSDVILTVSEYSKAKLKEIYGLKKPIHVVPNAIIDQPVEVEPGYITDKYGCGNYLLYVSRVEPRKNHSGLLKAYLQLKLDEQGYELVFIGARDLPENELDNLLAAHSDRLDGKVHFFQGVSYTDLQAFYAQSTLVVYPSLAEGFGIPPLEAAAHGKQVVCSAATAMSEFDFFRYHIDPNKQADLEIAIKEALRDDDQEYLEKVRKEVLLRYNWKKSAEELIRILENE